MNRLVPTRRLIAMIAWMLCAAAACGLLMIESGSQEKQARAAIEAGARDTAGIDAIRERLRALDEALSLHLPEQTRESRERYRAQRAALNDAVREHIAPLAAARPSVIAQQSETRRALRELDRASADMIAMQPAGSEGLAMSNPVTRVAYRQRLDSARWVLDELSGALARNSRARSARHESTAARLRNLALLSLVMLPVGLGVLMRRRRVEPGAAGRRERTVAMVAEEFRRGVIDLDEALQSISDLARARHSLIALAIYATGDEPRARVLVSSGIPREEAPPVIRGSGVVGSAWASGRVRCEDTDALWLTRRGEHVPVNARGVFPHDGILVVAMHAVAGSFTPPVRSDLSELARVAHAMLDEDAERAREAHVIAVVDGEGQVIGTRGRLDANDLAWIRSMLNGRRSDPVATPPGDLSYIRALDAYVFSRGAGVEAGPFRNEEIALVSHELRGPVTAMNGFVELMLNDVEEGLGSRQRRRAQVAYEAGRRVERIIDDLSVMSQRARGMDLSIAPEPLELPALVDECRRMIAPEYARSGVELSADVPPVIIRADPQRLGQALGNILHNALKVSHPGDHVLISADAEPGHRIVVHVDDQGPGFGIPIEEVFSAYVREGDRAGMGIGLAVVREIIGAHGGEARAENRPEGGARVSVSLPLYTARDEAITEAGFGADHAPPGSWLDGVEL